MQKRVTTVPVASATAGSFRRLVYRRGSEQYRDLPWRRKPTPYGVLVSEVMLQQTQAPRVAVKYEAFLKQFPTVRSLANSPLSEVLIAWQGLGYNRRAKALWQSARTLVKVHRGRVPADETALGMLPGVGSYTAAAVLVFAFNKPAVLIETNIRAVYLHHFFPDRHDVADKELVPFIEATLDRGAPRAWYTALFDYGAHLKRTGNNAARRSKHAVKQSRFRGSDRELRGAIIRALARGPHTPGELAAFSGRKKSDVEARIEGLVRDGLVAVRRGRVVLA